MSNKKTQEQEEIVDAKAGAVAVAQDTSVSTQVAVSGVRLEFPFIRVGQGMSQWKAGGKKPVIGGFYIGKNKDSNILVADMGKDAGITGIVLQKVDGFKEERKWQAGMGAPKRWVIAGTKEDGTPVTEQDCLEAAAKEGYSLAPKATGEIWPDSGRPIMRANLSRFCYLCMLVPLPDDFDSDEFRVYPIGDKLYTTARYEFDKQYFKSMDSIIGNIRSRAEFSFRQAQKNLLAEGKIDKAAHDAAIAGYEWSVNGLAVHLYSSEMQSRSGVDYVGVSFEKALRDGRPFEFTPSEKEDFMRFLASVKEGMATVDDADGDGEF